MPGLIADSGWPSRRSITSTRLVDIGWTVTGIRTPVPPRSAAAAAAEVMLRSSTRKSSSSRRASPNP